MSIYDPRDPSDLVRLVADYPLAWIVSSGAAGFAATPLPLVGETNEAGEIVSLMGHFSGRNPHVDVLRATPRALILFSGPQGYISPEPVTKPQWAPTWNYAVARFEVDIELLPQENPVALNKLVTQMERSRRVPWTVERMGERYGRVIGKIMAFRARVRSVAATFKLGQEETPETYAEVVGALQDETLVRWMRDFNPGRKG